MSKCKCNVNICICIPYIMLDNFCLSSGLVLQSKYLDTNKQTNSISRQFGFSACRPVKWQIYIYPQMNLLVGFWIPVDTLTLLLLWMEMADVTSKCQTGKQCGGFGGVMIPNCSNSEAVSLVSDTQQRKYFSSLLPNWLFSTN